MKTTTVRLSDILLTAVAPMLWGTTYFVATELLPPNHPLLVASMRSLPIGLLLIAWLRQLPKGIWWWRILLLGSLNIGLFQALLFVSGLSPSGRRCSRRRLNPAFVSRLVFLAHLA